MIDRRTLLAGVLARVAIRANGRLPRSCRSRRVPFVILLAGLLLLGAPTRALAFDDATKSAALKRYEAGKGFYEQRQYRDAAREFQLSLEQVPLPLLALWAARCYELAGDLFSAQSFYQAALRLTPNELWLADKQQRAQSDASRELERLTQRMQRAPQKTQGTAPNSSTGTHLAIRAGVRLDTAQPERNLDESRHWITTGWVSLTVGAAGLVVGTVTGLMLATRHNEMQPNCPAGTCDPGTITQSQVDEHNSLRTASTIGFVAGGVLGALGLTLVLTTPTGESGPNLALRVTPGGPLLQGAF